MYKKSLPITKRSAFKQVPEGAKKTGSSSESYLEESPSGQILDTSVLTTDYVTPGEGWKPTGVSDVDAYENADKQKYPTFDAFQAAAEAYRSDFKSPDTPGSTKDVTKNPLTVDEPGQPKRTGDAFYAPEKRKQYRTAKIERKQREKQAKRDLRKGIIDQTTYDQRLKDASTNYNTNISSIETSTKKQLAQGINPRTGRSVIMQEQKDPFSRPMTKNDLSSDQLSNLKTTNSGKSNDGKSKSSGGSLMTSFATGAADVVSNIVETRNKKALEDFNKAKDSAFPMKNSFKMKGFGSKNKK
jgi:hypothetical protein